MKKILSLLTLLSFLLVQSVAAYDNKYSSAKNSKATHLSKQEIEENIILEEKVMTEDEYNKYTEEKIKKIVTYSNYEGLIETIYKGLDEVKDEIINQFEERFHKAINDDLNMPAAMGIVWEVIRHENKSPDLAKLLLKFDTVLGIKIDEDTKLSNKEQIPEEIMNLVQEREEARKSKDWNKSDELRDLINSKGYDIKDTNQGTEVKRK